MKISILYQDDQLMVIDKPAGVTVNRANTVGEKTVQDWAEKIRTKDKGRRTKVPVSPSAFGLRPSAFYSRSGIVHRLDKETSGCLIIAKNPEVFANLQRQFQERKVMKEYLALVHGKVEPKEGTIRVPLARSRYDRQKFTVSAGGRQAETGYEVISYYSLLLTPYSLLRLFPTTGRTHQIRVHLKYFGHPIVADAKYAGEKRARQDRRWCPRLFLHAAKITFTHPVSGNPVLIEASLPGDLAVVIKQLTI